MATVVHINDDADNGPHPTRERRPSVDVGTGERRQSIEAIVPRHKKKAKFTDVARQRLFPSHGKADITLRQLGPYELAMWGLLMVNIVVATLNDPDDPSGESGYSQGIRAAELVLNLLFLLEWAVHAVLLGESRGAMKLLDLLVLVANLVLIALLNASAVQLKLSLLIVRIPRILRPCFMITSQPTIRIFVVSITKAIATAKDVVILYLFFMLWFSVAGVYQFGGTLRTRCVSDAYYANGTVAEFAAPNNLTVGDFVCGSVFLQNHEYYANETGYDKLSGFPFVSTINKDKSCSVAQTCVMGGKGGGSLGGFRCPFAFRCDHVQNIYHGFVGFDDLGQSFMSLFVALSFQLWYELMYWLADAGDAGAYIFFNLLILFGGFIVVNITVVVLTVEFEKARSAERHAIVAQLRGINKMSVVMAGMLDDVRRKRGEGGAADDAAAALLGDAKPQTKQQKRAAKREEKRRARERRSGKDKDAGDEEMAAVDKDKAVDFSKWDDPKENWQLIADEHGGDAETSMAPTGAAALLIAAEAENDGDAERRALLLSNEGEGGDEVVDAEELERQAERDREAAAGSAPPPCGSDPIGATRWYFRHRVVKTPIFTILGTLVILANVATIAYDHYDMDPAVVKVFDDLNLFFTVYFTVEMVARFLGDEPLRYFKKFFNVLDVVIVAVSWVDIGSSINFPVIRALRVLRLLKLLKNFPSLYEWLQLILGAVKASPMIILVLLLFQVTFASIAFRLFGGEFCGLDDDDQIHLRVSPHATRYLERVLGGGTVGAAPLPGLTGRTRASGCTNVPQANFDTFAHAMISAFQILTADDWELIMYNAMRVKGVWIAVLFLIFFYIGTYFLLNLIVAVLLSANQQEDTDFSEGEDLQAKIARLEQQEEDAERKRREDELANDLDNDDMELSDDDDASVASSHESGGGKRSKLIRLKSGRVKQKSLSGRFIDWAFWFWGWSQKAARKVVVHPATPIVMAFIIVVGMPAGVSGVLVRGVLARRTVLL
jgi:hypothetical protein